MPPLTPSRSPRAWPAATLIAIAHVGALRVRNHAFFNACIRLKADLIKKLRKDGSRADAIR
jgi:hypothetical protein